jgi:hypothetical protein
MQTKWYLALGCVLVAVGCTADEPGKKECEIGTSNPDLECISGYECKCSPDGCFCEKTSKLTVSPPAGHLVPDRLLTPTKKDHNVEYLERLGLIQPDN